MADRKRATDAEGPPPRMTLGRRIAMGITVPLLAAALLWWIAGSDMVLARWISLSVIVLALAGWHYSRSEDRD